MAIIDEITYDGILAEMLEKYEQEAGYAPDEASDIGIRLRVLATQIHSACESGKWLLKQMFFTTATGEYLDMHAEEKGIYRNAGSKASGGILFSLPAALSYDVVIPAGTVCSTSDSEPVRFVTTEGKILAKGKKGITVPAEAETVGVSGNVLSGVISVVVTPPAAGMTVKNTNAFKYGADPDDDEILRDRIAAACRYPSNGTNSAFYISEAMKVDGIQSVSVIPRPNGNRGKVEVYLGSSGAPASDEKVAEVAALFGEAKEINVDVTIAHAIARTVSVGVSIKVKPGYVFSEVKTSAAEVISDYFAHLSVGEEFSLNALGYALLNNCGGISDYKLTNPTENVTASEKQLIVSGTVVVSEWSE